MVKLTTADDYKWGYLGDPSKRPVSGPDPVQKMQDQLLLIRVCLGLSPCHDPVECVRVLYQEGREAFEKLRGERCDYAAQWKPFPPIEEGPDRFPGPLAPR